VLEKQILERLEGLAAVHPLPLKVRLWDGSEIGLAGETQVTLNLASPKAARRLLAPSLDSLGEAYVEGLLDIEGPIGAAIEIAERLAQTGPSEKRRGRLPAWLGRHTRRSDRKAIEYHYDVSNEFYQRFLDEAMVYSCAYYKSGHEDLETAQQQKLEHICRKLMLAPGQRLLDIGCGWGALVLHAARKHGVQAVGITLSRNQFELARQRVEQAGLTDRIDIRLQDYRDVAEAGGFDRIASVGMFEHVGLNNLRGYFDQVFNLLKPGGIAMNHGITSSDPDNREVALGAGEFIDRYVFPDGELPHVGRAIGELSAAGLELVDAESLRRHYASTLRSWSARFERRLPEMIEQAGPRRARIWRVYLAGCAHAFAHGWVNIYQLLAIKPQQSPAGRTSPLPLTRDYMYRDDWPRSQPPCD
jgi:cyclopropane-fatty-acyl-phospholipid synthase